jgi:mannosyltransferase OCH1-like enzyme
MSIPKIIHQTFKSDKLPLITRWHIAGFRKRNPSYQYQFYDDAGIESFLSANFEADVYNQYKKLNIGAAKADFFRYAVMLIKGGVYIDLDSAINGRLENFIRQEDVAVISKEHNPGLFVQWALVYEPGHPFMQKTVDMVMDNIRQNRYPHDVHKMTGPTVYSNAIKACLAENPNIPHRILGHDYNGHFRFHYPFSKLIYTSRSEHWKTLQITTPVLKGQ